MNIMTSSLNLSEIFNDVQQKLEQNIANMLDDVRSKNNEYKELHDNIMSLPFVAKLVEENKMLKEKLSKYETKRISLEVHEKPVATREADKFVYTDDGETILLAKNQVVSSNKVCAEEEEKEEEASAEEEEEEASAEEDEEEEEASAEEDEEEEEASAEEDEEEEEASAEEDEEEASAEEDEEEASAKEEEEEEEASAKEEEEEASAKEEEEEASAEEEEDEEEASAEDEEEVEEIMINKKMYYTTNAQNGYIYSDDDGDVGDVVGKFVNGEAQFD
jgi:hypothetical protein